MIIGKKVRLRKDWTTHNSTVSSEDEVSISFDGGSITGYNLSADLIRLRFDIQNITSGEVEI